MSASAALQGAFVHAASVVPELAGVFDGPPARAEFPYLIVDCSRESDWSCASRSGREIAVELTLWDDRPARMLQIENALEQSITSVATDGCWLLANLRLTSKATIRDPDGPWAHRILLRARLVRTDVSETAR